MPQNDTIQSTFFFGGAKTVSDRFCCVPTDTTSCVPTDANQAPLLVCYDSISAPYKDLPVRHRESMFHTGELASSEVTPYTRHTQTSPDWIFASVVVLAGIMSAYFNIHKFTIKDILHSIFDIRTQERVFRESNVRIVTLLPMATIYMACLALCASKVMDDFGMSLHVNSPLFSIYIFAALAIFTMLKNETLHLLGNLFDMQNGIKLYIYNNLLFHFLGALFAVPITLLIYYSPLDTPTMTNILVIFIAIIFIIRILRGIQLILTNSGRSKLHLFYYLCVLEIVPILVLIKIVIN